MKINPGCFLLILFMLICCSGGLCKNISTVQSSVNVKLFGALGNNKADDTYAVRRALEHGRKTGKAVYFPQGTYLVTALTIATSIIGTNNSVIKKISKSDDEIYEFCVIKYVKGIRVTQMVFDGSMQSSIQGRFFGSIPLFIHNSEDIALSRCEFRNSPMSGLRIESCKDVSVVKCSSLNLAGIFGDGFYVENASKVLFDDCTASNYTRIGFVIEKDSHDVKLKGCLAKNGRNASVLSGGGEYNAGYWYENSAFITTTNCIAENNTHFGFVATSGIKPKKISGAAAEFKFENCKSSNSSTGFRVSSSGNPVVITLKNCESNLVNQGFIALARDMTDTFVFSACTVNLITSNSSGLNDMGFMWESSISENTDAVTLPVFKFPDSRVNYQHPIDKAKLYSREVNNSDIGTYSGGAANIYIENFTNSLGKTGVIIKAIRGRPNFFIQDTKVNLNYLVKRGNVNFL